MPAQPRYAISSWSIRLRPLAPCRLASSSALSMRTLSSRQTDFWSRQAARKAATNHNQTEGWEPIRMAATQRFHVNNPHLKTYPAQALNTPRSTTGWRRGPQTNASYLTHPLNQPQATRPILQRVCCLEPYAQAPKHLLTARSKCLPTLTPIIPNYTHQASQPTPSNSPNPEHLLTARGKCLPALTPARRCLQTPLRNPETPTTHWKRSPPGTRLPGKAPCPPASPRLAPLERTTTGIIGELGPPPPTNRCAWE
jgi:hypothetical protein